jgi:hypothetical protein
MKGKIDILCGAKNFLRTEREKERRKKFFHKVKINKNHVDDYMKSR